MSNYQAIRKQRYETLDDRTSASIVAALRLVDQGCVDCDLIGSLDDLEETLAEYAGDDSELAEMTCLYCEDAVAASLDAINNPFGKDD